ncbi:MAG: cysteine--tRNA ligase [Candidatus Gottesmanbacteria bacterium]|nr:cysteine--tRNA ligase [Candidatus Gottesmanbacteria bacterium]
MVQFYNTLTKKSETFSPRDPKLVTVYCCGPTVYDYATVGNFRTYTMTDVLVRTLRHFGYTVKFVMNITDVGHLVSDDDIGEDKMEKGAKREGKTAWDIATFYTKAFLSDSRKLNLSEPDVRPKATEHIAEQIAMVQILLAKGYAYQIDDGIYYDTAKFPRYGQLTGQRLDELKAGARVEQNPQKRNPTDFALWKFSPNPSADGKKRDMEWKSPWGTGFPGWHIECSAMSRKHLGDQIDIHTGGVDLIPVHHTNEIAQSEASSGKSPFVRYWVHGQFLLVDGAKMAKSKGNFYRFADLEDKGFDPLALRYFYLTAHYRKPENFTWEGLTAAQNSLNELRKQLVLMRKSGRTSLSAEKLEKVDMYRKRFDEALCDDMNTPQSLAVVWEVVKSNIPAPDKYDLLIDFDEVLGLKLNEVASVASEEIPEEIQVLVKKRDQLRIEKKFAEADTIRKEIESKDYVLDDTPTGALISRR